MSLIERFLEYVAIDTRSETEGQIVLLELLAGQMHAMGLTDVELHTRGYLTATLTATAGYENAPVIGFLAHVDTSPDMSGKGVKPQIVRNYDGSDILLGASGLTLSSGEFPELLKLKGHTIVTTDGTTLLGADDKAGVAAIMTAVEQLKTHLEVPHGTIRIAFTTNEEVGRGVDDFDVEAFGARYAYTVDGGAEGEFEYENFNAASARVEFHGRNIHPGYACGKMVNALHLAQDFDRLLPLERPANTSDRTGFFHLVSLSGGVDFAAAEYLLRDFSREGLQRRKDALHHAAAAFVQGAVSIEVSDTYYNMREIMERHPEVTERALAAMREAGVEPVIRPIRGGTDGARLSFMGLPCPNLFTGGANFHGRYEYCSLDSMQKSVETIVNLARLWAK